MKKRETRKKQEKETKGFSIQFMPYSEIKELDSNERMKKILHIILTNKILIIQGRLKPEEETRLIGDTMVMIDHVKDFKGIELAVVTGDGQKSIIEKMKSKMINFLSGGEISALTIIGPASIIKDIKRDPKKIEFLMDK